MPSPLTDDAASELPRVGRYEILLELQEEAFVSTMAARVRGPNTGSSIVELTKVEHTIARQAEVRAAFLAEARGAGRVRHTNFVHPTDTLVHEGDLYVATEYVLGVRLDELWRAALAARIEIPLPVMLRIVLDVVAGLSALHARHPRGPNVSGTRSIVHGDIAPTNILVSYRGDAKLLHSGLSCVTSLPGSTSQRNRRLAYKAPEQLRIGVSAVPIEPAADVFAMGALLWEVLQGRRLFEAATDVEVVERILQGPLPAIDAGDRRVPIALLPLVEMALERSAERRIPNAAQLGDAIEHAPGVRLATSDEVALVVDQLVGPLIERRREKVNELFALAESRSPSDSTLRPAIISHLRQAGAMKTPVGLVYPPPSGAPVSYPPQSHPQPSKPPSSFTPSDRWIDASLPPPSSRFPSDSRWPAPPSSGKERNWDRSGSIPMPKARREGRGLLQSGWVYYLAIGAALGGLVFEYFIEAAPTAVPQPTTVLAPPPGAPIAAPAAPAVEAVPTTASTPPTGAPATTASTGSTDSPLVARPVEPVRIEPPVVRRVVPVVPPPAPVRQAPPRGVRRPAPPVSGSPEGAEAPPAATPAEAPKPAPTSEDSDWGI